MNESEVEPDIEETSAEGVESEVPPELSDHHERLTLSNGHLTPRHRRFCQLAAEGKANKDIGKELGYVDSRVSILLKNPTIAAEVRRLQDRIFEETISSRLKGFSEDALNNIHMILTDKTNRVKISEKMDISKWVIEKLDGKASQKIEAGENLLAALMDRLDAGKTQRVVHEHTHRLQSGPEPLREVSPQLNAPKSEESVLEDWVADFTAAE